MGALPPYTKGFSGVLSQGAKKRVEAQLWKLLRQNIQRWQQLKSCALTQNLWAPLATFVIAD